MTLQAIDYQAENAPGLFVESLKHFGFGVLKNHPIPVSLVESIYQEWQLFFSSDIKYDFHFSPETHAGFFPIEVSETAKGYSLKDIKEYFHYYTWGQCPDELRPHLDAYHQQATALASELLSWVEAHSPADIAAHYSQPLSSMITGSQRNLLRVLHYPPLQGDEPPGAIRAAAHEDINLLTLLPASNERGLQVKTENGVWLDVPCDLGLLIVNTGDMLQEASGGYFPSTTHQVINPTEADKARSRIALPLFLHPRSEVVLSARYTAESYWEERMIELGVM
ncbi:MAG: 2OG-Fe(II) oxygenase family protein [Pseudomonadota bacterium]